MRARPHGPGRMLLALLTVLVLFAASHSEGEQYILRMRNAKGDLKAVGAPASGLGGSSFANAILAA